MKVNGSLSEFGCATFFAFADGAAEPSLVVRVPRTAAAEARLAAQYGRLEVLRGVLPAELAESVTRPIGLQPAAGTRVGVEYAFAGRAMAAVTTRDHAQIRAEFSQALAWLLKFHGNTGIPAMLSEQGLRQNVLDVADWALAHAGLAPIEQRYLDGLVARAQAAVSQPLPLGWRHGDFWPRNVLVYEGRLGVVDWEHCTDHALPFGDVLLFPLGYGLALGFGRKMSPLQAFQWTFCQPGFLLDEALRFVRSYFEGRRLDAQWWEVFFPLALLELEQRQAAAQPAVPPQLARFRFLAQHPEAFQLRWQLSS